MVDQLTITYRDYSGELANIRLRVPDLTAANFDAQKVLRDDLADAIGAVTIGVESKQAVTLIDSLSSLHPASSVAQRELKWMVTYRGTDNVLYNAELPCPDIADDTLLIGNTDNWDPTDPEWVTFVTDFEALVLDSDDGAVTVIEVRLVGRNT